MRNQLGQTSSDVLAFDVFAVIVCLIVICVCLAVYAYMCKHEDTTKNRKDHLSNRKKKPRKIILFDKSVNITIIGKENADELIEEIKSSYDKQ